ncbi:MAG: redoxin domain-containing protein [Syntrophales bacterium]|jgi:peroxiredoxin|nr:redoxin domain-containing protein [Syntrophales bacterium]MDY0044686.1 redoxin domain-containing protein [Syntrophales bacterium]
MIRFFKIALLIASVAIFPFTEVGIANPPEAGEVFRQLKLPFPEKKEHRQYLGVKKGESFLIRDIEADVVIVEVLSMYCPFCQVEAPKVNELFSMIQSDGNLNGKVKIIGIAAGNSRYEAEVFTQKYAVQFPVFPDADFTIHKMLGEVRTPYFIGIKNEGKKSRVFYSKLGAFGDTGDFLKQLISMSEIENQGVSK